MKKRNVRTLQLHKKQVSNLQHKAVKGGRATQVMCNSVPRELGGLGCHLK